MRRYKGLGGWLSKAAKSAIKVTRLMTAGVILIWLMFFLALALFIFFAAIVGIASVVIVAPFVVGGLFLTGYPITFHNFAMLGITIPICLSVVGGLGGCLVVFGENDKVGDAAGKVARLCRNIAGLKQPQQPQYRY